MYTRHLFLLFFLLCSSSLLFAQTTQTVHGLVKDSVGSPVIGASVTIINKDGAGITFERTNHKGIFNCIFPNTDEHLAIKVTALGYQQFILPLSIPNEQYVITLRKTARQLQEVVIRSDSKISLDSDTLKYNVKAFADKNDRVIADLIGRLPGLQVDDKGAISYNGKRINNIYIDGDNLLGGKYRLATNNVPVEAVEQVQVIERDQPIKALNGYVVANNVSLNLKLTDNARTTTINTGDIGLGNKAYSAQLNNLIFKKQIKSINNLKTNNIGENLENENADIGVSSNGNESTLMSPHPYLSMENETLPGIAEKYYLMNNDNTANINTLLKFTDDWSFRLNVSTLQLKRKYNYSNQVSYILPNADTIGYDEIQHNVFNLNHWQIHSQIEKNSKSVYLISVTKLDLPKWDREGSMVQNGQDFTQRQPTDHSSLSNETTLVKALGKNNLLQYNSVVQYSKLDENLALTPGIQGEIMLEQQAHTKNVFINQSATYKAKFNQFVLSASLGVSYERNELNSDLFFTDSANVIKHAGSQFKNDVTFNNLYFFSKASAIYLFKKGSVSIETSPTYSFIHYTSKGNKYLLFNPIVEFRKSMGKYGESNFRHTQQTTFGQINDIYPGAILVNYRQYNYNNTPLPKTDIVSFGARYSYRKPLKMFFYNLNLLYDRTQQNFITAYTIDSGLTRSIAIDLKNNTDKYALSANISKYIFFLSINVSAFGNISLQKGNIFYNDQISPFRSTSMNLSVTARKKLFAAATLSVTGEAGQFINASDYATKNTTRFEKIKAEWQHNLTEQVLYGVTYNFTSYRQSLQHSITNGFMDCKVKYTPAKWKSYFELQGINLFDQGTYIQINSNPNQQSIFQMPLRARTLLLKHSFVF
ncbi:hypothetical protein GFS24_03075 [Chitinophaga sp. SYP-B3965]|uniref:carboxypeptidase-like regulatory domain-containing protein n=1 Tax=Chitinophaga sp. SYP-B3965 TaxID=2663120 RepID=UPI00129A0182|nr:carboxypeptidase-like regulatory domain-containing protein [Chitinophaga sp. SYP-B3965]MRG44076.1 hypothetical protein [Chitinophaga sp. SYP-B3965]